MYKLDAGNVAYSVGPGNHDMGAGSLYETYFGINHFSGKSWYGGFYGNNNSNNYSLFSASGMDFILINLQYNPSGEMLDWADGLLKAHPNRRGIVVSHEILRANDSLFNEGIYTTLKDNTNLVLMVCGHDYTLSDGVAYRAELGDDGHIIHIMLADYQGFDIFNKGGYLRILRFSHANHRIYATTYSPYVDKYITSYPDQMEMTYDMPLPVEFASFTASTYQNVVILNWQTQAEVNNYGFEIERGLTQTLSEGEGFNGWTKIGFVNGYGNSNSPKNYSFTDRSVTNGKFFYRLKQIDTDGTFEFSKVIEMDLGSIDNYSLEQNYPNPFNPTTTIGFGIPASQNPYEGGTLVILKVFDVLGNEVKTLINREMEAGYYSVDFNATGLSSGVYFYRMQAVNPRSSLAADKAGSRQVFIDMKKMLILK